MIGLKINFPAGRYHATPWGRHVNEGDMAWPPEPYRILRALIATWWRKADQTAFPNKTLSALIEALSETDPVYRLPDSVHAHTRHYMPQGKIKGGREDTKLVIDAFLRVAADDPLLIGWEIGLTDDAFRLLSHLAERMSYFGRAESIAVVKAFNAWPAEFNANAVPRAIDDNGVIADDPIGLVAVDVLAPIKGLGWAAHRAALLNLNMDKAGSGKRKTFEATIPERLVDAISVDTGDIQAAKWSSPPAGRLVLYDRPAFGPMPRNSKTNCRVRKAQLPTIARYVLAGKPRPSILDAVRIAELMRLAAMSKWGWKDKTPLAPALISGRDENGAPLRTAEHAHAFWLPEDADGDGRIDHIVVNIGGGIDAEMRDRLGRLTHLWLEYGASDEGGERGQKEWRLALEGFGSPDEFRSECALLRKSHVWRSATPYLKPRYGPRSLREVGLQISRELEIRGFPPALKIEPLNDFERPRIPVRRDSSDGELVAKFRRARSNRRISQPDPLGAALRLEFEEEVQGPIALGYGAHFGLGLFVGDPEQ